MSIEVPENKERSLKLGNQIFDVLLDNLLSSRDIEGCNGNEMRVLELNSISYYLKVALNCYWFSWTNMIKK